MEPIPLINDVSIWKGILESSIATIITVVGTLFTLYKIVIYRIDKLVKSDTAFIDTRFSLLIKEEKAELQKENKELRSRIEEIEHDYKILNERRMEELTTFLKQYK